MDNVVPSGLDVSENCGSQLWLIEIAFAIISIIDKHIHVNYHNFVVPKIQTMLHEVLVQVTRALSFRGTIARTAITGGGA